MLRKKEEKGLKKMKGASVTCGRVSRGFYQTFKEEIIPIVHKLIKKKEMLFNSSSKVSITSLIPKSYTDVPGKKNTGQYPSRT